MTRGQRISTDTRRRPGLGGHLEEMQDSTAFRPQTHLVDLPSKTPSRQVSPSKFSVIRAMVMFGLTIVPVLGLLFAPVLTSPVGTVADPAQKCNSDAIARPVVHGAEVKSIIASTVKDWQGISGNNVCNVNISITHPGTGDLVNNFYALPLSGWNGIFQGIGGGGYRAGKFEQGANQTVLGYSVGSTDAGHADTASSKDASSWALASPGNVNQYLLLDFARLSVHDMTVIGKALSESFYGRPVERSYWTGCSTGGRQGLSLAQYYPEDYDGILANAPAIQWNDFLLAQEWPFIVENNEGYTVPPCEFEFAAAAVIKACDGLDGLIDGIISAPALCAFQAQSLVGQTYVCGEDDSTRTFNQKAATVVDKTWQGPQTPEGQVSWYGLIKGANFSTAAPNIAGNDTAQPFGISDSWIRNFLARDVAFDTANVSYEEFAGEYLFRGNQIPVSTPIARVSLASSLLYITC